MDISLLQPNWKIEKIEFASLPGERLRSAGCNARKGVHGKSVPTPLAQVTINGLTGFGWSRITREQAGALVGAPLSLVFTEEGQIRPEFWGIEFPLYDWIGKLVQKPVYQLIARQALDPENRFTVTCYDTSLYIDDLHLEKDPEAVELIQSEAVDGWSRGHRHFKIKVGRGARFMPLPAGMKRDIDIILGVREAVGADANIMIDANNGYNLNLTKEVLTATKSANLYWIEEPFHEDVEFYTDLKEWMLKENFKTLISDGEGLASPMLVDWAKQGIIDVIQYDTRDYGFSRWQELGKTLDAAGIRSAPHNYGSSFGNYATCHLAAAIDGFQFAEWDEIAVPGLDASAYIIQEGRLQVPLLPGFGLNLDQQYFARKVKEDGWIIHS
ncbi:MAG: Mandelate racemase/muconate lactonizing protein [Bacilli bacterium]|nr:Mandelate racemase/muconate lactonizing protein [Bacilli bacterium]